jgi:hypothetical protein
MSKLKYLMLLFWVSFFMEEGVKFEKLYNDRVHLFVNNLFSNVIKKSEI